MYMAEFVRSYFHAWNHGDPASVAEHLADDGRYCDAQEGAALAQNELVTNLQQFFVKHRYRYELVGDIAEGKNTIAFQYRMIPLVQARKSASQGEIRGAEFITLRHGAAVSIFDYYSFPDAGAATDLCNDASGTPGQPKYAKSGLSVEQVAGYKIRLDDVMQSERPYLQSEMTLPKLAKLVGCSVNHLSQVINAGFGMSFFDYLNQFRVEHAKGLLSATGRPGEAVLNIAFAAGFNSNSAFYAAFKTTVGQAPARYRRSRSDADG